MIMNSKLCHTGMGGTYGKGEEEDPLGGLPEF